MKRTILTVCAMVAILTLSACATPSSITDNTSAQQRNNAQDAQCELSSAVTK